MHGLLHRRGTWVEVAGARGLLVEDWIEGARSISVDFDGEIDVIGIDDIDGIIDS